MKVTEYLYESYDEHTGKWVRARFYFTLDEIAALANARPVMESAREGERIDPAAYRAHGTGFPGPRQP